MSPKSDPIVDVMSSWKTYLRSPSPERLAELLDDDVVFYSPIVFTPQIGREITMMYLTAAGQTLPGTTSTPTSSDEKGGFRYTKEVLDGDTAVLEFETTVDDKYVNGVDIIRCNDEGRIIEFRVMIRPLQAVNAVHQQMARTLEKLSGSEFTPQSNPSH